MAEKSPDEKCALIDYLDSLNKPKSLRWVFEPAIGPGYRLHQVPIAIAENRVKAGTDSKFFKKASNALAYGLKRYGNG